ncbi:MAG: hypothetical protein EBR01_02220 [Proteobacteria bacterium]|nr:hypothetical protein [Pseudomonadota bacterium]NBY20092.1 hypothetical protein [bacterium]
MKKKTKKKSSPSKAKRQLPTGDELLNQVVKLTGLPHKAIKNELKEILEKKNINIHQLNLGQLRCAAASYVREIMVSLIEKYSLRRNDSVH